MTKYQRCNFIIQIHKFTVKIDTISINLLFECVMFVEFNFTSHVFLVMYQDIRFLNQDACFLNQEERRQFLIISVSERDWKREHRLEFKMASVRFYIPNAREFFEGLISLLQHCGDCVKENTDGGHAEFHARRQEELRISTHFLWFVGDVWSSYEVGPGESAYSGFGTFNAGNGLQITITCKTKQWLSLSRHYRRGQVLRRIHSYLLSKGQVMLRGLDMKLGKSKSMD